MAGASSKQKGSRFEYKIRDLLNETFDTDQFQRTPGSGAYMGKTNFSKRSNMGKGVQNALGSDLICPEWFNFSVECKNYNDKPSFNQILHGPDSSLDKWLSEVIHDAKNFEQTPLLVFNTTRKGSFTALPKVFLPLIEKSEIGYYLKYDQFIIIGLKQFQSLCVEINKFNNENAQQIQDWLKNIN